MPSEVAPAALRDDTAARRHLRCETCGTPWEEHTDKCSRHAYRYLSCCVGLGSFGLWTCCPAPAVKRPENLAACPHGCPCHLPDPDDKGLRS